MYKLADISLFESYQDSSVLCSLAVFNAPDSIEDDIVEQEPDASRYPQYKNDPRRDGADIGSIGTRVAGDQSEMYSAMEASLDANVEAVMFNLTELKAILPELYKADKSFNFLNDPVTHWYSRINTALDRVFEDLKTMFSDPRYNGKRLSKVIKGYF